MPEPAEILYLAPGLGTGGTEQHLARLLTALPAERWRAHVWNTGEGGVAENALRAAGIPVESVEMPSSLRQIRRLSELIWRLVRRRPALVHSYLYGRHWLDAAACRAAGIPYIGTRRNLAHWRHGGVLARERLRDRLSAAIVANSEAAASVARREGADAARLIVIPNGVPIDPGAGGSAAERAEARRAGREALGLPQEARVVGTVSSLKPIKEPLLLLEAFARRASPSTSDRLVLIGSGPLEPEIRKRVAALEQQQAVLVVGERVDPLRLLPALDLFVLASRAEGFSNALLEAMSVGLPVVATAVGGNLEAVAQGVNGWLVPAGDVDSLAAAIGGLLADRGRAERMGRAGRERAAAHYTIEAMAQAHSALYQRLLGSPVNGAGHAS